MVEYKEIKTQLWDNMRKLNDSCDENKYEVDLYSTNVFGGRSYIGRRVIVPSGILEEIKFLRKEIELWIEYGDNL